MLGAITLQFVPGSVRFTPGDPRYVEPVVPYSRTQYRKAQKKKKHRQYTRCGACGSYMGAELKQNRLTGGYDVWKRCRWCEHVILLA